MKTQFDTPEQLLEFTRSALAGYLNEAGKVFYSGIDSYQGGRVMFLGYNPGGTGRDALGTRLASLIPGPHNDFQHECWKNGDAKNTLQLRVGVLFESLGLKLPEVFTTNLYFLYSVSVDAFHEETLQTTENLNQLKAACWTVIDRFLHAVPADVILCNGTRTLYELLYWMNPEAATESKAYYDTEPVTRPARSRAPRYTSRVHGGVNA